MDTVFRHRDRRRLESMMEQDDLPEDVLFALARCLGAIDRFRGALAEIAEGKVPDPAWQARETLRWHPETRHPRKTDKDDPMPIPHQRPTTAKDLLQSLYDSGFVGMWEDRDDIKDSAEFATSLRRKVQGADLLEIERVEVYGPDNQLLGIAQPDGAGNYVLPPADEPRAATHVVVHLKDKQTRRIVL